MFMSYDRMFGYLALDLRLVQSGTTPDCHDQLSQLLAHHHRLLVRLEGAPGNRCGFVLGMHSTTYHLPCMLRGRVTAASSEDLGESSREFHSGLDSGIAIE